MSKYVTPASLRLAAYIVAVVVGLAMVARGALDAASLHAWVGETSAQLGLALTALGALAARNVDRTGAPPTNIAVDGRELVEALAPVLRDSIRDQATATAETAGGIAVTVREDGEEMLAELRRRIEARRDAGLR